MRYGHTNLIARDWRHLADFYTAVFGCVPVLPERDLHADWLARATRIPGARLRGAGLSAGRSLDSWGRDVFLAIPSTGGA